RVGQLVDVEHHHAVKLRHLVQVEIVGDDLAIVNLGELDQLHIDLAHLREVVLDNLYIQVGHLLDALQNVETAPAAVALHRIGGISYQLQLAQNKLGDHQHAVEEARVGDIGDAAVDNHARVEDFEGLFRAFFASEDAAQRRQIQQVALARAHHQADVGHPQQD